MSGPKQPKAKKTREQIEEERDNQAAKLHGINAKIIAGSLNNPIIASGAGYLAEEASKRFSENGRTNAKGLRQNLPPNQQKTPRAAQNTSSSKGEAAAKAQRDAERGRPKIVIPD